MASFLNLGVDKRCFLCLEYPIVTSTTAIIISVGCSTASLRAVEDSPPIPFDVIAFNPLGDTKNKTNPIKSCKCMVINVKSARRISLAPYSFFPKNLASELIVVITNIASTK